MSYEWYDGKKINEIKFCDEFLKQNPLKFIDKQFYGMDGIVSEQRIEKQITDLLIEAEVVTGISNRTVNLVNALKRISYTEHLKISPEEIHLLNGTLFTDGTFISDKEFCKNRINVSYNPNAKHPLVWLKFLSDLLETEDIQTLQEFMGYILINSTKAQAMLFIIGNGGEGKSRIGVVLYELFKNSAYFGSINELSADKFLKANLIGKTLLVDDDMSLEALKDTGFLKSLTTSETPLTVQSKGSQGIQAMLSVRTICFSNSPPKSLYDKTEGWARRLIILTAKPIPENRTIDRFLSEKLIAEKEGIFLWMFEGLQRLIKQNFIFTRSNKSEQNITLMKEENCNIISFLKDKDMVIFDSDYECSTADLHTAYSYWCEINGTNILKVESFQNWLKQNCGRYSLEYCDHVINYQGKRARGYRGIDTTYREFIK